MYLDNVKGKYIYKINLDHYKIYKYLIILKYNIKTLTVQINMLFKDANVLILKLNKQKTKRF